MKISFSSARLCKCNQSLYDHREPLNSRYRSPHLHACVREFEKRAPRSRRYAVDNRQVRLELMYLNSAVETVLNIGCISGITFLIACSIFTAMKAEFNLNPSHFGYSFWMAWATCIITILSVPLALLSKKTIMIA